MEDHEMIDPALEGMPKIYTFQFMPSDLDKIYYNLLQGASVSEVSSILSKHIGENIEPLGWKAVWKPTAPEFPTGASFRVNVVDVHYKTLEASVVLMEMIFPKYESLSAAQKDFTKCLLKKNDVSIVPLVELLVIESNDEVADINETAYIIEICRIFFKSIWRPWDDNEECQDEDFVSTRLKPRLNFMWDMKNGIISPGFIKRFDSILGEAFAVKEKMNKLSSKLMSINDQEVDPDEDCASEIDASEFIVLKMRLQSLEREMKIIEDGDMRALYPTLVPAQFDDNEEPLTVACVHIVSKCFTSKSLMKLMSQIANSIQESNRSEWPLKLHTTLPKAIVSAKSGDVIYLSQDTYNQPLPWIENDIEVIGIGRKVELLTSKESGDVFLFINCESGVKLSNLTITANHSLSHLIVVKHGKLVLDNCTLDCKEMAHKKAILSLPEGSIEKRNRTTVINDSNSG